MGQQQLLLVILVTIIVGIATVVAINTFGSAADSANQDAVRQDIASIAAAAQGFYMKPDMLGGGGRSFDGITFNDIAFAGTVSDDDEAHNENGTYVITSSGDTDMVVTAYPASCYSGNPPQTSCDSDSEVEPIVGTITQDALSVGNSN